MGAGNLNEPPVRLNIVFDRFPSSIRGALVVRGADPDPHQATVSEAVVADLASPGRGSAEVGIAGATVHVRPRGEVVIPFEVPFADLSPGWYLVSVKVSVDGQQRISTADPARRFLVAWPRDLVRRGTLAIGRRIEVPGAGVATIEGVEGKGDRAIVRWSTAEGSGFGDLRVRADGKPLPVLEASAGGRERSTTVYPLLRAHRSVRFQLDRRTREDGSVERGDWSVESALD